jgi:hypothetical protein
MANGNIYRDTIQSETSRPTLAEITKARPIRGDGAPSRCASHKSAILALLRERGPEGVLGSELYARPELYGRSPRNRISELRKAGCLISGEPHDSSDWHYVLLRDSAGTKPFSDSTDWYERQAGRPRPGAQPIAEDDCFVLTPPEPRP